MVSEPDLWRLLAEEYFTLQKIIEDYKQQSLTIKGWSVTVGFAALVAVYTQRISGIGRMGVALAGLSALPFLILDALWKSYQLGYYPRICSVEMALAREVERVSNHCVEPMADRAPQIFRAWEETYMSQETTHIWEALTMWSVLLPHVVVIFGGILLALFYPPRSTSG